VGGKNQLSPGARRALPDSCDVIQFVDMSETAKPDPKPSSRDAQRAEALRANLLRRKAQARGRTDSVEDAPPKSAVPKLPGDA
jgi:hypothetical protein